MTAIEHWKGPLLRTGSGHVLLAGSALADVVRALKAAQHVTHRDGFGPSPHWVWLLQQLEAELAAANLTSPSGIGEVPPVTEQPFSTDEPITTREAAGLLDCTARNIRGLHERGVLQSGRLVARRLVFDRTEIVAEALRRTESQRRERL